MLSSTRSLLSRSHAIPASRLSRVLFPGLRHTIRQLYVQDGHVRLVLADGSWLAFSLEELGLSRRALAVQSNDAAVRHVVDLVLKWKARQRGRASLYEVTIKTLRLRLSPAVLPHYEAILSRS